MVTVKSDVVKTSKFEHEIAIAIRRLKALPKTNAKPGVIESGQVDLSEVLKVIREVHTNCLEYLPENVAGSFHIIDQLDPNKRGDMYGNNIETQHTVGE